MSLSGVRSSISEGGVERTWMSSMTKVEVLPASPCAHAVSKYSSAASSNAGIENVPVRWTHWLEDRPVN